MKTTMNARGVTIIAAIFIIVVLGFMGVMFVSMIGTGSLTAVNDVQSAQALYVAEAGVEYDQRALAQNLDWYRSATDPMATTTRALGVGSFTVSANLPATKLRRRLQAGDIIVQAYSVNRFPSSGFLQVEEDVLVDAEFVRYTGIDIALNNFTGVTRGVTIGTIGPVASAHPRGSGVYPVTTLSAAILATSTAITIVGHPKFLSAGTIDIEGEEIAYTGSTTAGGITTLQGVLRGRNGTTAAAHANGQPVTPILLDAASPDYEAEIVSSGTVANANRIIRKTVIR